MTDQQLYEQLAQFISPNKRALFDRIGPLRTRHVTVVLEDIYQSQNASAVVRTSDLVGLQDIHVIENRNAYQLNPDVTLGSSKWVDVHRYRSHADNSLACVEALKKKGYRVIATSPRSPEITPETIDLERPMAFCFGTELTGLSDTLMNAADEHLRIPMVGFTESYNISVSAAITLYTVMQRLRASTIDHRLPEEELHALKLSWARKMVHSPAHLEERLKRDAQRQRDDS
ncbi:MAG TPA: RNA methyltransferase [Flavobacteriales bacterium]|nr:RNA methyltransferase [Flavobacteriales bacterium]